jgi:hypothetical protein
MLSHTSTEWAPWYVVPGDHKWFARIAASAAIVVALAEIDPRYPEVGEVERRALQEARAALDSQARGDAARA